MTTYICSSYFKAVLATLNWFDGRTEFYNIIREWVAFCLGWEQLLGNISLFIRMYIHTVPMHLQQFCGCCSFVVHSFGLLHGSLAASPVGSEEVLARKSFLASRPLVLRSLRTLFHWILFYYLLFWSKVKVKMQTCFRGVDTFLKDAAGDSRHFKPLISCAWSGIVKWKCIWILWSKLEDFF